MGKGSSGAFSITAISQSRDSGAGGQVSEGFVRSIQEACPIITLEENKCA